MFLKKAFAAGLAAAMLALTGCSQVQEIVDRGKAAFADDKYMEVTIQGGTIGVYTSGGWVYNNDETVSLEDRKVTVLYNYKDTLDETYNDLIKQADDGLFVRCEYKTDEKGNETMTYMEANETDRLWQKIISIKDTDVWVGLSATDEESAKCFSCITFEKKDYPDSGDGMVIKSMAEVNEYINGRISK
jgi:hypothetical protein